MSISIYFAYKSLRGYKDISFVNVVKMPFDFEEHRRNLGEYNIKLAEQCFQDGDYYNGLMNLRNGLARSPKNRIARMRLAQLVILIYKDKEYASNILTQGLIDAYKNKDSEYLALTCAVYAMLNEKREESLRLLDLLISQNLKSRNDTLKIARSMIASIENDDPVKDSKELFEYADKYIKDPQTKKLFAVNIATIQALYGKFDDAFAILSKANISSGEIYNRILAAKLWNEGKEYSAVKMLMLLNKNSKNPSNNYSLLYNFYKSANLKDKAFHTKKLMLLTSDIPEANEISIIMEKLNDSKLKKSDIDSFIKRNASNIYAIKSIAELGLQYNNAEIINALPYPKIQKDIPAPDSTVNLLYKLEYAIMKKDSNDALSLYKQLELAGKKYEEKLLGFKILLDAISKNDVTKSIIHFAETYSKDYPSRLIALGKIFIKIQYYKEATLIANILLEKYPEAYKVNEYASEVFLARKDYGAIASLAIKAKSRISFEALNALSKLDNDSFIMLSEEDLKIIKQKIKESKVNFDNINRL